MTKIINIETGKVREIKPPKPALCDICGDDTYSDDGSIKGEIGKFPIVFCKVCLGGIVRLMVIRNEKKKENG